MVSAAASAVSARSHRSAGVLVHVLPLPVFLRGYLRRVEKLFEAVIGDRVFAHELVAHCLVRAAVKTGSHRELIANLHEYPGLLRDG